MTSYLGSPFSLYLLHPVHEALQISRNRPLRNGWGRSRHWSRPASRDQSLLLRHCFLSFVQCFLPGVQLRFALSELLLGG